MVYLETVTMTTIPCAQTTNSEIHDPHPQNNIMSPPSSFQFIIQPSQSQLQSANSQQIQVSPVVIQGVHQAMDVSPVSTTQEVCPQTITTNEVNIFPVRTLKKLGGIQIGLGVVLCFLSCIGTIINRVEWKHGYVNCDWKGGNFQQCSKSRNGIFQFVLGLDLSCVFLSGFFIITGLLPMCMSQKKKNCWRCMKTSFMVCSIVGASVFGPALFSLGVTESIVISGYFGPKGLVLSIIKTFLSFMAVVVAIVSASYCCCCTKWNINTSKQQDTIYLVIQNPESIMVPQQQNQSMNTQPVVMTTEEHHYVVDQHQLQTPTCRNVQDVTGNPPRYSDCI